MQIWVDADACPLVIKEILFRAAERAQVMTTLVANQTLRTPPSRFVRSLQVERGFDVADNRIVKEVQKGDLVITADIPLAAEVIAKGGHAIDPRGEEFSPETIRERLQMRDLMDSMRDTLRAAGVNGGGPAGISQTDRRNFGNALDRFIARSAKASGPPPQKSP